MIADHHRVIFEIIHHIRFDITFVERVKRRSLELVSPIEKENILTFGPYGIHHPADQSGTESDAGSYTRALAGFMS